jgi:hypothetical protein
MNSKRLSRGGAGFQPLDSWETADLGLRPRLGWYGPLARVPRWVTPLPLPMNQVLTTETQRHRETGQTVDTSVPPCLCGEPLLGSWTHCAIRESWGLPMNLPSSSYSYSSS